MRQDRQRAERQTDQRGQTDLERKPDDGKHLMVEADDQRQSIAQRFKHAVTPWGSDLGQLLQRVGHRFGMRCGFSGFDAEFLNLAEHS